MRPFALAIAVVVGLPASALAGGLLLASSSALGQVGSSAPACATWCSSSAKGMLHCGRPDCADCGFCASRVACTPSKKEDLSHESCERWCKDEHAAAHCTACSCKSCSYCKARAAASVSPPPPPMTSTAADAPASTTAGSRESAAAALEGSPVASPPPPPKPTPTPVTTEQAVAHEARAALGSLATILAGRNVPWAEAFKQFDRKGNGMVAASEIQRVFHNFGLPPLPLHGLPPSMTTLHGVDYNALATLVPTAEEQTASRPAATPPPPPTAAAEATATALGALATVLSEKRIPWDDAFKQFDRKGNGMVAASEIQRVFHNFGLPPLPLHGLPPSVTTLYGINYRALAVIAQSSRPSAAPPPYPPLDRGPATPPPPPPHASDEAVYALTALATILAGRNVPWAEAFKQFDRKGNGMVAASEIQRVFHNFGLPPLPLHGLPPSVTTLHGVDYMALATLMPRTGASLLRPAAPPPPPVTASVEAQASLRALATALHDKGIEWDDAFRLFDRSGNGMVAATEVHRVFQNYGLPPVPLHGLPPAVTTLHGIDYHALAALVPSAETLSLKEGLR